MDGSSNATRRRVLRRAGVAGTALLAGCTGPGTSDGTDGEGGDGGSDGGDGGGGDGDGGDGTDATATDTEPDPTGTPSGPQRVDFTSTADTSVVGTLYGEGDTGVVLVPQINRDRGSWEQQATTVADLGHTALAIDEDPDNRAASALGAMQYLRDSVGVSKVVLVGASSGGEAVVRATARADEGTVDGVVALSPGGGEEVADGLQGRKLFVASENDDDRFVRVTRELHEGADPPKDIELYAGSAHGQAIFDSQHGGDLRERLFDLVAAVANDGY
jgi:dienelactone hydrolase